MRSMVILVAALAAGMAVFAGVRALIDSLGLAIGAGVIVAWIVGSELGDRLQPSASARAEEEDRPLLLDPVRRRRILGVLVLLAATAFIVGEFALGDLETADIREWGEDLGFWGPILLIGVLAVAMVFAPIPNPPFMIAAGLIWGTVLGVVYAVIGQLLGAVIAFTISRYLGRGFMPRLVGERGAERIDTLAQEMGPQIVFWWRMMPISFDFAAYAAGLTPISFRLFVTLVLFGSIVPTAVVVGFGDSFNHSWTVRFVAGGLIVVAIVTPATILYLRNRHRLPPPREMLRTLGEWTSQG